MFLKESITTKSFCDLSITKDSVCRSKNIFLRCVSDLTDYLALASLENVRLLNVQYNEFLNQEPSEYVRVERHNVFTNRIKEKGISVSENWLFEAIPNSYNLCRIKINEEYLVATEDKTEAEKDLVLRKVVTGRLSVISDNSKWEITKFKYGYLIKNVAYSEYLFAGEDDRCQFHLHFTSSYFVLTVCVCIFLQRGRP